MPEITQKTYDRIKPQLDDVTAFKAHGKHYRLVLIDSDMGYPFLYLNRSNDIFCAKCASKIYDEIESYHIFYEGESLQCDECQCYIESYYGNPNSGEDD